MARARNIKPSFFRNELLAEVSHEARLTFIGLWCLADKAGRLEDRPRRIQAELWPYHAVDMDGILNELSELREPDGNPACIRRYEADGLRFIEVVNFAKHQHSHHREPNSTIPAPGKPLPSPCLAQGQPVCNLKSLIPNLKEDSSELPHSRNSKPSPREDDSLVLMTFEVVGTPKMWGLPQSLMDKFQEAYPDLNVLAECRKADAWLVANPTKRKTARGMSAFLNRWLARAVDSGRGGGNGKAGGAVTPSAMDDPELVAWAAKVKGQAS